MTRPGWVRNVWPGCVWSSWVDPGPYVVLRLGGWRTNALTQSGLANGIP